MCMRHRTVFPNGLICRGRSRFWRLLLLQRELRMSVPRVRNHLRRDGFRESRD